MTQQEREQVEQACKPFLQPYETTKVKHVVSGTLISHIENRKFFI